MIQTGGGGYLRIFRCVLGVLLVLAAVLASARAETPSQPQPGKSAAAAGSTQLPDAYKMNMLIRTTLIALSQANQTGNYSVLRDLGTPSFQSANTDARLGEIFASLRRRQLDFSPIVFFDPKLIRPADIQSNGLLRLTGYFDTSPERILFDMGFELIDGGWRLAAIIVDMKAAPEQAGAGASASPAKGSGSSGTKQAKSPKKKPAATPN